MERVCKAKKSTEGKIVVAKEAGEVEGMLFMAQTYGEIVVSNTWLIDSGCSNHLISNMSLFSELDKSFRARAKIRNGVYLSILGIGIMSVNTASGIKFINDLHYVAEAN